MDTHRRRRERLKRLGVTVQTEYQDQGKLKIRRSDGSVSDDVVSGVILDKKYYCGKLLRHQETEFNPGILYSFTFPAFEDDRILCPNCGGVGKPDIFAEGCPFCGSYYNLKYASEDAGSRANADYVSYGRQIRWRPIVTSIAVCGGLAALISFLSGRTMLPFDALKGLVVGIFVGAFVGLFWSSRSSKESISSEDRAKKLRQETMLKQLRSRLEAADSNLSEYANALDYALEEYYFGDLPGNGDVIDYDLLDYVRQTVSEDTAPELHIETQVLLREVRCRNGKITARKRNVLVRLKKNRTAKERLKPGVNFRSCPNCGASLDLAAPRCGYCGSPVAYEKPFLTEGIEEIMQ